MFKSEMKTKASKMIGLVLMLVPKPLKRIMKSLPDLKLSSGMVLKESLKWTSLLKDLSLWLMLLSKLLKKVQHQSLEVVTQSVYLVKSKVLLRKYLMLVLVVELL
jgi:hypothetical protein